MNLIPTDMDRNNLEKESFDSGEFGDMGRNIWKTNILIQSN